MIDERSCCGEDAPRGAPHELDPYALQKVERGVVNGGELILVEKLDRRERVLRRRVKNPRGPRPGRATIGALGARATTPGRLTTIRIDSHRSAL